MLGFWLSGYLAWDFPNNFWSLWETLGNEELPTRVGRFHMYSKGNLEDLKIRMCPSSFFESINVSSMSFFQFFVWTFHLPFVLSLFLAHLGTPLPPYLFGSQGTLHQRFSPTNFWPRAGSWIAGPLDGWCQTWLWSFQWGTSTPKIALLWCAWCETWCNYKWDHPCLSRLGGLFMFVLFTTFFDVVGMEWN